jgi:pre-mRNA-splicing helicase BRR2
VLQADRKLMDRRVRDESTGEAKTLVGKLSGTRMGDRVSRAKPSELQLRKKKRAEKMAATKAALKPAKMASSVLGDVADMNLKYRPRTTETQHAYELILSFITDYLNSQPQDILMGAADEILVILKDDGIKVC